MATRLILPALLLLLVSACAPSEEVISSTQATATAPSLYPPLSADAEPHGDVHEYH